MDQKLDNLAVQISKEAASIRSLQIDLRTVETPYLFELVTADEIDGESDESETNGESDDEKATLYSRTMARGRSLLRKAKNIATLLADPKEGVRKWIELHSKKTVVLRLLCGVTLQPCITYDIDVRDESVGALVTKCSKILQTGLVIATGWNCLASAANVFGVPAPKIPKEGAEDAQDFLQSLQGNAKQLDKLGQLGKTGLDPRELCEFAALLVDLDKQGKGRAVTPDAEKVQCPHPTPAPKHTHSDMQRL